MQMNGYKSILRIKEQQLNTQLQTEIMVLFPKINQKFLQRSKHICPKHSPAEAMVCMWVMFLYVLHDRESCGCFNNTKIYLLVPRSKCWACCLFFCARADFNDHPSMSRRARCRQICKCLRVSQRVVYNHVYQSCMDLVRNFPTERMF